jgi:hypothetical protein
MTWTPDKITALVLLAGCFILVFTGHNSSVVSILTMAAGYLFGTAVEHNRKNNTPKK